MGRIQWTKLSPRHIWRSLGIDGYTAIMMLKGGLPPTILIAMFQSLAVANIPGNFGYLGVTIAIVTQCLQPRAIFMKITLFSVLATCVSASLCCLGVFCSVKAREHTTPPGGSLSDYNSSASAVAAIWFLFDIWIANTIRTYRPFEFQTPMIASSIFVVVIMTRAPRVTTLSSGLASVKQVLYAFLLGFAISTAVALFTYPVTSRGDVFYKLKRYPESVNAILEAEITYVKRSESDGPWRLTRLATRQRTRQSLPRRRSTMASQEKQSSNRAESDLGKHAEELKSARDQFASLHSSAYRELYYAKQEIALGKLTAEDLDTLFGYLRSVVLPLSGIGMLPAIFQKLSKTVSRLEEEGAEQDGRESYSVDDELFNEDSVPHFIQTLSYRLESAARLVNLALQHTFISLGLETKKRKKFFHRLNGKHVLRPRRRDEEDTEDRNAPGGSDFTRYFEEQSQDFYEQRKNLPHTWASLNAFSSPPSSSDPTGSQEHESHRFRKEFFVVLFIGHLQDILLRATSDLVKFADSKVADGTMTKSRLIFPKMEYFRQWIFSAGPSEEDEDQHSGGISGEKTDENIAIRGRDPLKSRFADPEHLPPVNKWQKFGDGLRWISHGLTSDESSFGFRVAIASFSAGILAYLQNTQTFYAANRVNWVVIITVIAMSPTSGRSLFGLISRVVATTLSTGLAFAVWYIVVGKTAGVIVLVYVANCIMSYFYIKYPQFIQASIISLITFNLIFAYELQVRTLGIQKSTSTGLPYFPIYLYAPYRLISVAVACVIAFIWTIFPSPSTAGSQMRKSLGRSLVILANFYSCIHTSVKVWIRQEQGDSDDPSSPGRLLDRARFKLFSEEMALLNTLRTNSRFTEFEPSIGGRFPKKTYDTICNEIQTILISMDLMAHSTRDLDRLAGRTEPTSRRFPTSRPESQMSQGDRNSIGERSTTGAAEPSSPEGSHRHRHDSHATQESHGVGRESRSQERSQRSTNDHSTQDNEKWINRLAEATSAPSFHYHIIASGLYHLAAAVSNGLSLPPYLAPPHPFPLARNLRRASEDLLDIRNVEDPSFSAFVAIEVLSTMVSSSLKLLVSDVKELVGELNFEIYVSHHRDRMHEEQRTRDDTSTQRS